MKKIEILGPGCAKCKKLFENVEMAVRELGVEYEVEKVTDINEIVAAGVISTPAITIDGVVISSGRVLSVDEIKNILA
ncbi:MAG: TM0996/MTH895 family glutaredoxin-like protein [Candidatus Latescibacterota bacterium]|nr:MAG: TM0996/MTH895 family glutaredoxin-like protein [Candidatus Latescibacterota bacterium]